MIPVGFGEISRNAQGVLNRDFFYGTGGVIQVSTSSDDFRFNSRGKFSDGNFGANLSGRHAIKGTGIAVSQSLDNKNQFSTKFEYNNSQLRSDVTTNWVPGTVNIKSSRLVFNYFNALMNSKMSVDLFNPTKVVGSMTMGYGKMVGGSEVTCDIAQNKFTRYALSMGIYAGKRNLTFLINDAHVMTLTLYQKLSPQFEAAAKTTTRFNESNKTSVEVATAYRHNSAQYKLKLNDAGLACLSYKVPFQKNISLGLGISMDVCNPTVKKFGWSLNFQ